MTGEVVMLEKAAIRPLRPLSPIPAGWGSISSAAR
jgi:hypothetical protein